MGQEGGMTQGIAGGTLTIKSQSVKPDPSDKNKLLIDMTLEVSLIADESEEGTEEQENQGDVIFP